MSCLTGAGGRRIQAERSGSQGHTVSLPSAGQQMHGMSLLVLSDNGSGHNSGRREQEPISRREQAGPITIHLHAMLCPAMSASARSGILCMSRCHENMGCLQAADMMSQNIIECKTSKKI